MFALVNVFITLIKDLISLEGSTFAVVVVAMVVVLVVIPVVVTWLPEPTIEVVVGGAAVEVYISKIYIHLYKRKYHKMDITGCRRKKTILNQNSMI